MAAETVTILHTAFPQSKTVTVQLQTFSLFAIAGNLPSVFCLFAFFVGVDPWQLKIEGFGLILFRLCLFISFFIIDGHLFRHFL